MAFHRQDFAAPGLAAAGIRVSVGDNTMLIMKDSHMVRNEL